jgi:hypothetical protein
VKGSESRAATLTNVAYREVTSETSEVLETGQVYSRPELESKFGILDPALDTGVFQPKGHESVWMFVTEKKTPDKTQYADLLDGDVLYWDDRRPAALMRR